MAKITEIMRHVCFTTNKNNTVRDVIKQLADEHIGWIPIVDDDNRLLAYITDGDIIRYISKKRHRFYDHGDLIAIEADEEAIESKVRSLLDIPVIEIAGKKNNVYATVDNEIEEVAEMFRQGHLRLIAVLDDKKVVGVVNESDIVRHILLSFLPEE